MIGSLNSTAAGRALFGGDASDRAPLAGAQILQDELRTVLSAAPDAASIKAALDTFFDSPGGGFATTVYRGGAGEASPYALGAGEAVTLRIRGDDAALRDQLKQTAMLSLIDDPALALAMADRARSRRRQARRSWRAGRAYPPSGTARFRGGTHRPGRKPHRHRNHQPRHGAQRSRVRRCRRKRNRARTGAIPARVALYRHRPLIAAQPREFPLMTLRACV